MKARQLGCFNSGNLRRVLVMSVAFAVCAAFTLLPGAGLVHSAASLPSIKIGAAGPYSGDLSKIGLDGLNAIKMAVEEANAAGGVRGRKIEIVEADDAGDSSKAILVAEKLAMDRAVLGVVGPMNSSTVEAALPTYQRAGLAIVSQIIREHDGLIRAENNRPMGAKFTIELPA